MDTFKLSKLTLAVTLALSVLTHTPSYANETQDLKNQVKALQERIEQLEKQVADQPAQPAAVSVVKPVQPAVLMDQWDPFAEMRAVQQQMGQLMKDNLVDFNPREDIKQTPDAYIVSMDIPGMDKDNINVEVKQGMLIVSGERKSEIKEEKPNQYHRMERSFGHFYRTMALPDDAKADSIDAKYENGVLTVKVARTKPEVKTQVGQKIKVK